MPATRKEAVCRLSEPRRARRDARTGDGLAALGRRQKSFALSLLASGLAGTADSLGLLTGLTLGGLLIGFPLLHLAENALALHLLLENTKSLIDIVVANQDLQKIRPIELSRYP